MKTKHLHLMTTSLAANRLGFRMTAMERRAGRYMRAPDHPDGGGDPAPAAGGDPAPTPSPTPAAAPDPSADPAADPASDGGSILSDAAKGDDGKGGAGDDAPRSTFGEGEAAAPILGAPEAYEVTVPEALAAKGVTFDKEAFDAVEPILRDLNLSNAAAQQLVAAYAEKVLPLYGTRAAGGADEVAATMRREWSDAAAAEFNGKDGNPTLQQAKAYANQAFLAAGIKADSPFISMLEESGLGNHPDMIRFVSWVGRNIGEAGVDPGTGGGEPPVRLADKVYGKPIPRDG